MSEAELHILKARMRGGQLNKARRGELEMGPPVGLVYRADGVIDLDPDAEVQAAVRLVFETFDRTGKRDQDRSFLPRSGHPVPAPAAVGAEQGRPRLGPCRSTRASCRCLHNPRYAGGLRLRASAHPTPRRTVAPAWS